MTDSLNPEDQTSPDRAEKALRRALRGRAGQVATSAPDAAAVRRLARHRSVWRNAGIAAAVLATVAGTTVAVRATTGDPANEAAGPAMNYSALAASAPEGWRWEYYRDVAIAIPGTWHYSDVDPTQTAPCATPSGSDPKPPKPYYGQDEPAVIWGLPGCRPAPHPLKTWADHVYLAARTATDHSAQRRVGPWTIARKTLGHDLITVVVRQPQLAPRILATARIFEVTPLGCQSSSAIQSTRTQEPPDPFDLAQVPSVSKIVVCQYDVRAKPPAPGLVAETVLSGPAADRELAALKRAPISPGSSSGRSCDAGSDPLLIQLVTPQGVRTMYVYYEACRLANGFHDGTNTHQLTSADCRPLIVRPVEVWVASGTACLR